MAGTPIYSCNANTLLISSTCYLDAKMAAKLRRGIEIYARVQNLAAIGGTNYKNSLTNLMTDSGTMHWRGLACDQREAIACYRTVQDAIFDGASISSSPDALREAAVCYSALSDEDQKNILAFLSCAISTLGKVE